MHYNIMFEMYDGPLVGVACWYVSELKGFTSVLRIIISLAFWQLSIYRIGGGVMGLVA